MKIAICLLLTVLCSIPSLWSQTLNKYKETYNWIFGHGVGLTWNKTRDFKATGLYNAPASEVLKGLPTEFATAPLIYTREGCFTISDKDGNLLFYSDGITLWDESNKVITKSLKGHESSGQSGLLLPYPGDLNKKIVISNHEGYSALYHSVLNLKEKK